MMKNKLWAILFLFTGCSLGTLNGNNGPDDVLRRRNLEEYFASTDVVRYFLPELPQWANFSEGTACYRSHGLRFLDFEKLHKSFNISYKEAVNLQITFNIDIENAKREKKVTAVPPRDEENIFFSVRDKIQSKIYNFTAPRFDKVDIIWIDPIINDDEKIFSLLNSEERNVSFPIILSACASNKELEQRIKAVFKAKGANGETLPFKYISAEMFSVFTEDFKHRPYFSINLNPLLPQSKNKALYIPKGRGLPINFEGKFQIKYY